jgi:hypothetical protein
VRIRQALTELVRELAAAPTATPDPHRLRRFTRESLAGALAEIMDGVLAEHPRSEAARFDSVCFEPLHFVL